MKDDRETETSQTVRRRTARRGNFYYGFRPKTPAVAGHNGPGA